MSLAPARTGGIRHCSYRHPEPVPATFALELRPGDQVLCCARHVQAAVGYYGWSRPVRMYHSPRGTWDEESPE